MNCSIMPTITLLCVNVPITAESVKVLNSFYVYKIEANNDKFQHILLYRNGPLNDEHVIIGNNESKADLVSNY